MEVYTLRPAARDEAELLAAIKAEYVRSLYRGFLDADYLRRVSAAFYLPEVNSWLQDDGCEVDVLEMDGVPVGYVVYGADAGNPGCGLFREAAIQSIYGRREKDVLVRHAIEQLKAMGFMTIHLWVLRDNFRVRFLFESLGFRADGTVRVEPRDNLELSISRYVYHVPAKGSGWMQAASIEME